MFFFSYYRSFIQVINYLTSPFFCHALSFIIFLFFFFVISFFFSLVFVIFCYFFIFLVIFFSHTISLRPSFAMLCYYFLLFFLPAIFFCLTFPVRSLLPHLFLFHCFLFVLIAVPFSNFHSISSFLLSFYYINLFSFWPRFSVDIFALCFSTFFFLFHIFSLATLS